MKSPINVPFGSYRRHAAYSQSDLKTVLQSPERLYEQKHIRRFAPSKETPAMFMGTLLHTAILEPERFHCDYAVCPPRNTKAGKEKAAELERELITPMTAAQAEIADQIMQRVNTNDLVNNLLMTGEPEVSFFDVDPETGLAIKGRLDWLTASGVVIDVKTVGEGKAGPHDFSKQIANFRYHMQAAHYLKLAAAERFVFIAVEREPNYGIGVYELDAPALAEGAALRRKALRLIADCEESGVWPGYTPEIQTLSLPSWGYDN